MVIDNHRADHQVVKVASVSSKQYHPAVDDEGDDQDVQYVNYRSPDGLTGGQRAAIPEVHDARAEDQMSDVAAKVPPEESEIGDTGDTQRDGEQAKTESAQEYVQSEPYGKLNQYPSQPTPAAQIGQSNSGGGGRFGRGSALSRFGALRSPS